MATSIDKSTNWRGSAEAPDYQVAARRVDTYVQPERNSKGKQIAEALEQTSGTISQVGKQYEQSKRRKQQASLETLEARLIAQRDADPSYNFEDDTEYKGLLEEHRIYIANRLGKDADYVYTKELGEDGKPKVVTYTEIQDHLNANQGLFQDPAELDKYLNQYHVPIEEENDGANIHFQASHANAFDSFKDKLKGEGVLRRKDAETRKVEDAFESTVRGAFVEGGTPQEIWDRVFNADQGLRYDNTIKSRIITKVAQEYAVEMKDETILMEHNIPHEIYKKPVYKYVNKKIAAQIEADAWTDRKNKAWWTDHQKALDQDEQRKAIFDALQSGQTIDTSTIEDVDIFNFAKQMQAQGILDDTVSKSNLMVVNAELKNALFSSQPLTWNGKTYDKSVEGVTRYLMQRGGLNQQEMNKALEVNSALVEGASIDKFDWYEDYITTPATNAFNDGLYVVESEQARVLDNALNKIRNDVGDMYVGYMKDGYFSPNERNALRTYAINEANALKEIANQNKEITIDTNTDEVKTQSSGDEFSDFLDNLNVQDDSKQAEPVVEDKVEGTTTNPKTKLANKKPVLDKKEIAVPELIKELESLSTTLTAEDFEGLTVDQIAEAYGEELLKAHKTTQNRKALEGKILNFFTETIPNSYKKQKEINEKLKSLTKAQRQYYERTGKFPDE